MTGGRVLHAGATRGLGLALAEHYLAEGRVAGRDFPPPRLEGAFGPVAYELAGLQEG